MARRDAIKLLMGSALIALIVLGVHWLGVHRPLDGHRSVRLDSIRSSQRPPELAPGISGFPPFRAARGQLTKNDAHDIEVCGVGRIPRSADDVGGNLFVGDLTKPALKRWIAALRNSGDNRARATGIFISTVLDDRHAEQSATREARDELVAMAIGSGDPAVYAIALGDCASTAADADSSCQRLSPVEWAKLDQDNAIPWLLVAARARENHDMAAEASAFTRASQAHKSDSYNFAMLQYAEPEMPGEATPLERWNLAINIIGVEAALPEPAQSALSHCSKEAVQAKAASQECEALAELWVAQPATLLDLIFGKSLGARVGWPAKRIEDLTQRVHAYEELEMRVSPTTADEQWTCKAVEQGTAYIAKLSKMSEIEIMTDLLDQSGETVPELSREYSERLEKLAAEAHKREKPSP